MSLQVVHASEITMMIGVGSVKDSDAVFFQYMGDKQHRALRLATQVKPLTSLRNVSCVGLTVADNIGEFDSYQAQRHPCSLLVVLKSWLPVVLLPSGLWLLSAD